jgi:hypothetical protein
MPSGIFCIKNRLRVLRTGITTGVSASFFLRGAAIWKARGKSGQPGQTGLPR